MKYIIVLGDGMADEPITELRNQTPLEYASTNVLDELAKRSEIGMVHTIPTGLSPGSDTANLAVLGYDPKSYYTGRSPLEALSIGVPMKDTDIALRCNLVTVSEEDLPYEQKIIEDHSSSEITTKEATLLLNAVKEELESQSYQFHVGTSYRHLTIWKNGKVVELVPPHDILGKQIGDFLPREEATELKEMMKRSYEILNHHKVNEDRKRRGLNKANSLWFWGAGTKPNLTPFYEKFQKKGSMISAVDLLKGIAVGAQMNVVTVPGADGTLHTNYEGKARAALKELLENNKDFVYIHVEAPDEMGHQGNVAHKIEAIEQIDKKIIKVIVEEMKRAKEPYRMLVMPDHPTPVRLRTHTADAVPYLLYDSTKEIVSKLKYNEKDAKASQRVLEQGYQLIERLFADET